VPLEGDNSSRASEEEIDENVYRAIEAIDNCERPVIYAGGGINIAGANEKLVEFD